MRFFKITAAQARILSEAEGNNRITPVRDVDGVLWLNADVLTDKKVFAEFSEFQKLSFTLTDKIPTLPATDE